MTESGSDEAANGEAANGEAGNDASASDASASGEAGSGEAGSGEAVRDEAVRGATTSLIFGLVFSQISGTVSRLGVPDAFPDTALPTPDTAFPTPGTAFPTPGTPDTPDTPGTSAGDPYLSVGELARATGTHAPSLRRLLRAAAALGLFTVGADERFALTPLGRAFRDEPAPRALAAMYGEGAIWRAYGALEDSVRGGRPAFEEANGTGLYEALAHGGALADRIHTAMSLVTSAQVPVIVRHYDFGAFRHIVDVGGGDGTLLAAILATHQDVHGTLAETAPVLAAAGATLKSAGVEGRCTAVTSDFLTSVPSGADAYVLKNILHNFDDPTCVRILRNCRAAAAPHAKVLVPTLVLPDWKDVAGQREAALLALSDIEMMVLTPGRERTLAEHTDLFARAGLELTAAVPLPGLPRHFMLEAGGA